jgi:hypothetical protein
LSQWIWGTPEIGGLRIIINLFVTRLVAKICEMTGEWEYCFTIPEVEVYQQAG